MELACEKTRKLILILLVQYWIIHCIVTCSVEGKHFGSRNSTNVISASSPWLKRVIKNPRAIGCWDRPWICHYTQEENDDDRHERRGMCCHNRCVDVFSDVNNCGLCGIRCPFTWKCCKGMCVDTNNNPFHCGTCHHKCHLFTYCSYGMCGYAQPPPPFPPPCPSKPCPFPPLPPLPPFPFPSPPHPPKPFPFPPKPPRPFPPHPPKPFPPHEPFPFPPHAPQPPWGARPPPLT